MDRQKLTKTMLILIEVGILCAVIAIGVFLNASNVITNRPGSSQSEQTGTVDTQEDFGTEESTSTEGQSTENSSTENVGTQVIGTEDFNTETLNTEDSSTENLGTEEIGTEDISTEDFTTENSEEQEESETRIQFSAAVEEKLLSMTTEEKVAQLFLITPESITGVTRVTSAGTTTRNAINRYPVGGFIYAKKNFLGVSQTTTMIKNVNEFSNARIGLPMFIVVKEDAPSYSSFATLTLTMLEIGAIAMEVGAAPAIPEGIPTCTYSGEAEIIEAINAGMDMIYAPSNFTKIYAAVLEAVNNGIISQVRLENAVGRVLTEKIQ